MRPDAHFQNRSCHKSRTFQQQPSQMIMGTKCFQCSSSCSSSRSKDSSGTEGNAADKEDESSKHDSRYKRYISDEKDEEKEDHVYKTLKAAVRARNLDLLYIAAVNNQKRSIINGQQYDNQLLPLSSSSTKIMINGTLTRMSSSSGSGHRANLLYNTGSPPYNMISLSPSPSSNALKSFSQPQSSISNNQQNSRNNPRFISIEKVIGNLIGFRNEEMNHSTTSV